ncbi:MAG: TolC family protein, partial [Candidatus Binataceae bacterium]
MLKHIAGIAAIIVVTATAPLLDALAQDAPPPFAEVDALSAGGPSLTLDDLQRMAFENNPVVGQAADLVEVARGQELQAGLYPNPVVGYTGDDITPRQRGGKHGVYFEQTIVTAGKLGLNRELSAQGRKSAEATGAAQRLQVAGAVTQLYYELLIARRTVEIFADVARLAGEFSSTAQVRYRT